MTELQRVFTMSDRAIVLYFALRELGGMTAEQMRTKLRWSTATIYRAMQELRRNQFLPPSPWDKPKPNKPKPSNAKTYALQSDLRVA